MSGARVLGYEEAGSGPLLVLVHAFPLDSAMWEDQLRGLAGIRRVVAVDLRGRGRSRHGEDDDWTIDTHADDLARTIDELGMQQADLAGISMGGYVLFSFWRRHRERVRSLILMDTKATADPEEARQGRERTAARVRKEGTGALLEELLPRLLSADSTPEARERVKMMFLRTPGETAARDALAMRDRPDSTVDLPTIDVPTLVLNGTEDVLVPMAVAAEMAGMIPGVTLAGIPRAGHLAPLEQPFATNRALREFLQTVPLLS